MTERKVVHQIKLDRSVKAILWGFVAAIALNAVPDGFLIEDAMAQSGWPSSNGGMPIGSRSYAPLFIECVDGC